MNLAVFTMLVWTGPGHTVVKPIPAASSSARRQSENMYTAALLVQYALSDCGRGERRGGRDVDDVPTGAALDEPARERPAAVDDAAEVDVEDPVPLLRPGCR